METMKCLKNLLEKPSVVKSIIGGLLLTIGILSYQDIDLSKQNKSLMKEYLNAKSLYINNVIKYSKLGEKSFRLEEDYSNLVRKYNSLRRQKIRDSLNYETHLNNKNIEIISLKKENIQLNSERDILINDYLHFAKSSLETIKEKRNIIEELMWTKDERNFYKNYASYVDSLLFVKEFGWKIKK